MTHIKGTIDIGRVVSNTFGTIARHPDIFLGLSFLFVGLPSAILLLVEGEAEALASGLPSPVSIANSMAVSLVTILVSVLLQAVLIVATVHDLGNRPVILRDCLGRAVRKLLPLIGLGIVMAICIGLGLMLLILPGIILALMWTIATPVMMAEDKGVMDSLTRSAELTSGSKGAIFLLVILFLLFAIFFGFLAGMLSVWSAFALMTVSALVNTVTGAVQAAGVASLYLELRAAKEGADTGQLAEIFS